MVNKVIIGGGRGFIGSNLKKTLISEGYSVTNVSRMPGPENLSWQKIATKGLPKGLRAAVNVAGQNFMDFTKRWTPGFKQNVAFSRINTTRIMSSAINNSNDKPRVMVLVTGVGYYNCNENEQYDETSPSTGNDFFSKLCIDWEKAASINPPVRLVIIRSGVVLGRDGGMIKNMFVPFWLGLGGPLGSGKQLLPWIHVDDLVRLIIFAIENDNVVGVLNGVAPQVITNNQFTEAFGKALRRPAAIPVPEVILKYLLNPERAMIMTQGQCVIPRRVIDYGFEYKYGNIEAACKEFAHLFPK